MNGDLPQGWTWAEMQHVCLKVQDGTHFSPKQQSITGDFKYITAKNIKIWGIDLTDVTYVNEDTHRSIYGRCNPEKNDVLYIKDGATTGIATVNTLDEEFSLLSSVALLKPIRGVLDPTYLKWYLNSPTGFKAMTDQMTGSAITRLILKTIRNSPVPLAPFSEQRRIVAKLERLLSKVDACQKRLEKIPLILKRFRQAVLAAACSGRLTEDWREENECTEDANELLQRTTSRAIHKDQKNALTDKLNQIIESLPGLPENWMWVPISMVSVSISDGDHQAPPKSDEGIPFVVISNLSGGTLDLSDTMFVPEKYYDSLKDQRRPMRGDVLYTVTGSYGISVIVDVDASFCFQRHIALVRPLRILPSRYIQLCLASPYSYLQASAVATGIAQLTVSLAGLRALRIPLAPLPEQAEIVRRVEALFKVADQIEARYTKAKAHVDKLTPSILAKAFRGELVPQDPNDEPAEVLLERIKRDSMKNIKQKRSMNARDLVHV